MACPLKFSSSCHLLPEHVVFDASVGHKKTSKNVEEAFVKEVQWSPDGSTVMAVSCGDCMSFFTADPALVKKHQYYESSFAENDVLQTATSSSRNKTQDTYTYTGFDGCGGNSALHMGSTVVDSCWYPFMNSADPASSCFLTACRDKPIHLWNYDPSRDSNSNSKGDSGDTDRRIPTSRCSYRCYNQYDEVETVQAISFNATGDRIYACTKNMIRIFDVNTPGRECLEIPTVRFKRDPMAAFKGLISSIEFGPDPSMKVYSCATYSNSVAVYVEGTKESVLMLTEVPTGCGITCQRWNPNGNHLWVGGRHSSDIICYDLRSTRGELGRVSRRLETNQKLTFDLDPWGKHLITGSQDGEVLVYDTMDFQLRHRLVANGDGDENSEDANCTNSVSCHPHSALLCLGTGRRVLSSDSDEEEEEEEEEERESEEGTDDQDRMDTRALKASTSSARSQSRKVSSSSGLRLLQVGADKLAYPAAA